MSFPDAGVAPSKEDHGVKIAPAMTACPSMSEGVTKPTVDSKHQDAGLEAYTRALELDPAHLERLSKRVLLKLDYILLPLIVAINMTAYLEKAALNYANAFSMRKDLHFVGQQYSWTVASVSIGMLVGAYPSSLAIQKLPLGIMMSALVFIWGVLTMSLAAVTSFGSAFAVRFLLGLAESSVNMAWVVLISMFWTRNEQPLRLCIYLGCNGLADMLGPGIAIGLGHVTHASVHPWQLIFLVIGAIAVTLSVVAFFFLPSAPGSARILTKDERLAAVWRIRDNQTGVKNTAVLAYQVREAALDVRVWCLIVQQFAAGMANGGLGGYYSAFLEGFGWSALQSIEYQLPIGAFQFVACIVAGYLASRFRNRIVIIILVLAIFAIVSMVGFSTIPRDRRLALTAMTWLGAVYGGAIILNFALVAANFAGHTKRMTVNGVAFVAYYAGNFAGPFVFLTKEAPRYHSATVVLAIMLGIGWIATALMGLFMWRENRRRDAKAAAGDPAYDPVTGDLSGFTDLTDKENKSFRYRY